MKRLFMSILVLTATATALWAQYPFHSIKTIQQVPAESLAVADTSYKFWREYQSSPLDTADISA